MTTTTFDPRQTELQASSRRFVLAAIVTIALLAAVFMIGRVTAPTHTVRSIVTVPAAATAGASDSCPHVGVC